MQSFFSGFYPKCSKGVSRLRGTGPPGIVLSRVDQFDDGNDFSRVVNRATRSRATCLDRDFGL